jgi:hypothetical protein
VLNRDRTRSRSCVEPPGAASVVTRPRALTAASNPAASTAATSAEGVTSLGQYSTCARVPRRLSPVSIVSEPSRRR